MPVVRLSFLIVASFLCTVQIAFAAGGGGMDGGGGGGEMVPSQDRDGATLSQVFSAGVAFLADGECKRAEKKFRAVLEKVPRNSEANYLLGISLQCRRNHTSAIRYFKRAKRDDVGFFQAYEALGISYLTLERPDLAEKELKELAAFKKLCNRRNRVCPATLLKSHRKLLAAVNRIEGRPADSEDGDEHGLLFDHDVDSRTG